MHIPGMSEESLDFSAMQTPAPDAPHAVGSTPGMAGKLLGMQGASPAQPQGFDTQKFITDNRIHVEHGSLILQSDPLLPLHPRELAPENEPRLRAKIKRAFTTENYDFFKDHTRAAISSALAGLIPISASTKEAELGRGITDWLKQLETGKDAGLTKKEEKLATPFKAVIDHYLEKPEQRPANIEFSKNALGMYLLMEEALREHGYRGSIIPFAKEVGTAEGLVAKLSSHLGFDTRQFLDTAGKEGLDGIGKLLGVDETFVRDVKKLGAYLEDHKFSANAVANWQIGRKMPGMKNAGIAEQIEAGLESRVNAKIMSSRMAVQHRYEVPEPIQQTEQKIAGMMKFLPPELAETLYLLGTEIAFTPETTLKPIADVPAYGFHRRITEHPDDVKGIYQIFLSGKHNAEEAVRVLVHEAHHLMIPGQFSPQGIALVDGLAKHDMMRLKALKELTDSWMTGDDATKAQVVNTLNRPEFSIGGKKFSDCIGQAEMLTFYTQVQGAYDWLQGDSETYHRSGYAGNDGNSPMSEIIPRYAELRYVRQREHPEMLSYIVPGMTVSYEQIYLPHVREQLQDLRAQAAAEEASRVPAAATTAMPQKKPTEGAEAPAPQTVPVTSRPVGAATTIEASTAQLQGMLYGHTPQTMI